MANQQDLSKLLQGIQQGGPNPLAGKGGVDFSEPMQPMQGAQKQASKLANSSQIEITYQNANGKNCRLVFAVQQANGSYQVTPGIQYASAYSYEVAKDIRNRLLVAQKAADEDFNPNIPSVRKIAEVIKKPGEVSARYQVDLGKLDFNAEQHQRFLQALSGTNSQAVSIDMDQFASQVQVTAGAVSDCAGAIGKLDQIVSSVDDQSLHALFPTEPENLPQELDQLKKAYLQENPNAWPDSNRAAAAARNREVTWERKLESLVQFAQARLAEQQLTHFDQQDHADVKKARQALQAAQSALKSIQNKRHTFTESLKESLDQLQESHVNTQAAYQAGVDNLGDSDLKNAAMDYQKACETESAKFNAEKARLEEVRTKTVKPLEAQEQALSRKQTELMGSNELQDLGDQSQAKKLLDQYDRIYHLTIVSSDHNEAHDAAKQNVLQNLQWKGEGAAAKFQAVLDVHGALLEQQAKVEQAKTEADAEYSEGLLKARSDYFITLREKAHHVTTRDGYVGSSIQQIHGARYATLVAGLQSLRALKEFSEKDNAQDFASHLSSDLLADENEDEAKHAEEDQSIKSILQSHKEVVDRAASHNRQNAFVGLEKADDENEDSFESRKAQFQDSVLGGVAQLPRMDTLTDKAKPDQIHDALLNGPLNVSGDLNHFDRDNNGLLNDVQVQQINVAVDPKKVVNKDSERAPYGTLNDSFDRLRALVDEARDKDLLEADQKFTLNVLATPRTRSALRSLGEQGYDLAQQKLADLQKDIADGDKQSSDPVSFIGWARDAYPEKYRAEAERCQKALYGDDQNENDPSPNSLQGKLNQAQRLLYGDGDEDYPAEDSLLYLENLRDRKERLLKAGDNDDQDEVPLLEADDLDIDAIDQKLAQHDNLDAEIRAAVQDLERLSSEVDNASALLERANKLSQVHREPGNQQLIAKIERAQQDFLEHQTAVLKDKESYDHYMNQAAKDDAQQQRDKFKLWLGHDGKVYDETNRQLAIADRLAKLLEDEAGYGPGSLRMYEGANKLLNNPHFSAFLENHYPQIAAGLMAGAVVVGVIALLLAAIGAVATTISFIVEGVITRVTGGEMNVTKALASATGDALSFAAKTPARIYDILSRESLAKLQVRAEDPKFKATLMLKEQALFDTIQRDLPKLMRGEPADPNVPGSQDTRHLELRDVDDVTVRVAMTAAALGMGLKPDQIKISNPNELKAAQIIYGASTLTCLKAYDAKHGTELAQAAIDLKEIPPGALVQAYSSAPVAGQLFKGSEKNEMVRAMAARGA